MDIKRHNEQFDWSAQQRHIDAIRNELWYFLVFGDWLIFVTVKFIFTKSYIPIRLIQLYQFIDWSWVNNIGLESGSKLTNLYNQPNIIGQSDLKIWLLYPYWVS